MKASTRAWLHRIPGIAASLLALTALLKMEGASIAVPVWMILIGTSAFTPARVPNSPSLTWLLRLPLFGFAIATNLSRTVDIINVFDTRTMTWMGEMFAAELVLASWKGGDPSRTSMRPLWLSSAIMLAASSTPDDTFMIVIAPAFFLALLLALRGSGAVAEPQPRRRLTVPWRFGVAAALVLLGGGGVSALITAQRAAITAWGMQILSERVPYEAGALSVSPTLTSTFGQRGAMTRVMRIEGSGEFSHMRGLAYNTYLDGTWGPRTPFRQQQEEPITTELDPARAGNSIRVTRLLRNNGIIFTPLNAIGLRFPEGALLYRFRTRGGLIRTASAAPSQYEIVLPGSPEFQGPICLPPTEPERERLLAVPPSIDPRVGQLCREITGAISDPRRRILAIDRYLRSHHQYSLRVDIGRGDPISNFLLQRKAAHCEFFASAAVILSRLAGVPSRYVVGYLAHEEDGPHVTTVRQRDAHAWAECWLDGTGWVVLDATPGDGRPDALTDKPSPMQRAFERMQDFVTELRLGTQKAGLLKWALGAAAVFVVLVSLRALWTLLAEARLGRSDTAYSTPAPELFALYREFVRTCRANGLNCPPDRTWQEYLDTIKPEQGSVTEMLLRPADRARRFITIYNSARFGARPAQMEFEPLRLILAELKTGDRAAPKPLIRRR